MLEEVLASPLVPRVAKLIEKRLGRKLEPFDIWYAGFKPRGAYTEEQLDAIVQAKYPTPEAYKKDIPNLLVKLGFSKERAQYLADHIEVDPARGSGHALGRPAARATTRTCAPASRQDGMNYKGFNIAVHEMGHNVEQTFSLNDVDSTLLQGVPEHRLHRGAGLRLPGARPGAAGPRQARRAGRGAQGPERLLGDLRDRGRRARRHGRLALDVRPPGRDAGAAEGGDPQRSAATSGTGTTRRSSGNGTSCCSASTRT